MRTRSGGASRARSADQRDGRRRPRASNAIIVAAAKQSAPLDVAFDAPWLFLGAALAGGLAGAFVRGRGRGRWRGALAIGVVSALIMTLAYAAGIDWPAHVLNSAGIDRSGEAVVFVLGAIGALVGVSALVLASGR